MKKSELKQIIKEEIQKILNNSEGISPEWINPNSPKAKILTNVYYIGDGASGELKQYRGEAVPSYELSGYTLSQIKKEGDGMLYIQKGEEGWYDEEEGTFESYDENSTTRIKKEYIKLIP
jgi:hypothetical protein